MSTNAPSKRISLATAAILLLVGGLAALGMARARRPSVPRIYADSGHVCRGKPLEVRWMRVAGAETYEVQQYDGLGGVESWACRELGFECDCMARAQSLPEECWGPRQKTPSLSISLPTTKAPWSGPWASPPQLTRVRVRALSGEMASGWAYFDERCVIE